MRQTEKLRKIHEEAITRFRRNSEPVYEVRRKCLEDRRFYSVDGAQWEGSLAEQFENKPKLEMNKIHLSVIKIFNEYRNNRISVDFITKDGTTDSDLADTCDGLFRADEQDSVAEEAYDNAFEEAVGGGMGALRLTTEYEDEEDEENEQQRIRIEPIYDADSSVFFDIDAKRQDKSDAKYCFVMFSMSPEDFEDEYDISPASMTKDIEYTEYDWFSPDLVYIAEYYKVEEKKETIHIYQGLVGDEEVKHSDSDFEEDEDLERTLEATGYTKIREKKVKRRKVHKYIISGNEVLEDCGYIAGKCIPIIPTYGKRWYVDSNERCMGHVRLAKDAQRVKNMLMSKLAEISSLSAVEKPILMPEQVAGHEDMWASDNVKNYPYLLVSPLTGLDGNPMPAGPIAYTKPPSIPPALASLMQLVDVDMKELLGNYNEADKMISHVSGKAAEMLQKRIDGQAFIYMDNHAKSIHRVGEVWLSMAKEVYVEKGRKMKTIDSSGQTGTVELVTPALEEGLAVDKNDITQATFDVAVSVGPTSASQREATVQSLLGMLQITTDPETQNILQSMALMNMEGDGLSEAQDYFRKQLVEMGVIKPTKEESEAMAEAAENAEPTPNDQLMLSMAEKEKAEAQQKQADTAKKQAETEKIYSDIQINSLNAVKNTNRK